MWKNINQLIGRVSKTTSIPKIKKGETTIENDQEISETLNEYFSNVGPELLNQIPKNDIEIDDYIKPVSDEFKLQDITITKDVTKAILIT